jgi:hypothetical protein
MATVTLTAVSVWRPDGVVHHFIAMTVLPQAASLSAMSSKSPIEWGSIANLAL